MTENAVQRYDMTQEAMTPATVVNQVQLIQHVMEKVMKDGEHYGVIPGCGKKPSLLKAGAEKLSLTFRLAPAYEVKEKEMLNGHREYYVKCTLTHIPTDKVFGQGVGACSTMEGKYRFRKGELLCPECGKATIIKGKKEFGGGWICYGKKGGCGKKWTDADNPFEGIDTDRVEHDNPADYYNTVLKMAKKRAHVDAVLTATAASDIFTQDVEDMPEVINVTPKATPKQELDVPEFAPPEVTPDRYPIPITLEQQTTLNGIIIDKGVEQEKFLKYMGVAALAEIKAQDYKKAIEALKLAKGAKEA
jgi:hypothetical protein